MNQRSRLLTGSVPLLPPELVPSILHHAHSCLYPEDRHVFGFPGTESPKYVWLELPGPGECSGRSLLDSRGLGIENRESTHLGSPWSSLVLHYLGTVTHSHVLSDFCLSIPCFALVSHSLQVHISLPRLCLLVLLAACTFLCCFLPLLSSAAFKC